MRGRLDGFQTMLLTLAAISSSSLQSLSVCSSAMALLTVLAGKSPFLAHVLFECAFILRGSLPWLAFRSPASSPHGFLSEPFFAVLLCPGCPQRYHPFHSQWIFGRSVRAKRGSGGGSPASVVMVGGVVICVLCRRGCSRGCGDVAMPNE